MSSSKRGLLLDDINHPILTSNSLASLIRLYLLIGNIMLKKAIFIFLALSTSAHSQAGVLDEVAAQYASIKTAAINFKNSIIEKPKVAINERHKTKAFLWSAFGLLGLCSARYMQLKIQKHIEHQLTHHHSNLEKVGIFALELCNYGPFLAVGLHSGYKSFEKSYEHIKAARN